MSKAREWARGRSSMRRPVWTHGRTYRAAPVLAGKHGALNGVAIAKDGHRRLRMDTPAALSLARWILDTFGEPDAK